MYEYEDFYNEPSEFEMQIDEFKQSLLSSVKAEYTAEMARLKAENAELQGVKNRLAEVEREHRDKLYELERAKNDALNIVRREKLSKLLEGLYVRVYSTESYREDRPKCDKCNERRKITFLSPSGREMEETCFCGEGITKYRVIEKVAVEFASRDGKVSAWYKPSDYKDSDHMVSSDHMDNLHDDIPFSEIKHRWSAFFLDKEKCQAYCDWLTNENVKAGCIPSAPRPKG